MENKKIESSGGNAAIEAGKEMATNKFLINGSHFLVIDDDQDVRELKEPRDHPLRTKQHVRHTTAESFIKYYNKFATENSVIFINTKDPSFLAVIDYHGKRPGWKEHISKFGLQETPEFWHWQKNNKIKMSPKDFILFIEQNLTEITHPNGAEILETALIIQAETETSFSYQEEVNGTAGENWQLKIPDSFKIGLQLYVGGDSYEIEARLRYRVRDGNLVLWYELIRPNKAIDCCANDSQKLIAKNIIVGEIYHGSIF